MTNTNITIIANRDVKYIENLAHKSAKAVSRTAKKLTRRAVIAIQLSHSAEKLSKTFSPTNNYVGKHYFTVRRRYYYLR